MVFGGFLERFGSLERMGQLPLEKAPEQKQMQPKKTLRVSRWPRGSRRGAGAPARAFAGDAAGLKFREFAERGATGPGSGEVGVGQTWPWVNTNGTILGQVHGILTHGQIGTQQRNPGQVEKQSLKKVVPGGFMRSFSGWRKLLQ